MENNKTTPDTDQFKTPGLAVCLDTLYSKFQQMALFYRTDS